jgi:hypothetical protein
MTSEDNIIFIGRGAPTLAGLVQARDPSRIAPSDTKS